MAIKGAGRRRATAPTMSDARAKGGVTVGGLTSQEIYFQLSAFSSEDARLRTQLELLRAKERRVLHRLETVAAQSARLRQKVDALERDARASGGKQQGDRGYGDTEWDVTELRY